MREVLRRLLPTHIHLLLLASVVDKLQHRLRIIINRELGRGSLVGTWIATHHRQRVQECCLFVPHLRLRLLVVLLDGLLTPVLLDYIRDALAYWWN